MASLKRHGKRSKPKGLRYLDLSFEGRHPTNENEPNNGVLPHGGYKGSKYHPPGQFSHDKSREYHDQLRNDIDNFLDDEYLTEKGTPKYVADYTKETVHSGESPLFTNKLLAQNKLEQQYGPIVWNKALLKPNKCGPPLTKNGVTYYRPIKAHQFLTNTELRNASAGEVDIKLGRPTRAMLLRARQRCNSAPLNSYETRRENQRKSESRLSVTRPSSAQSGKGPSVSLPEGESMHSFLIGARYNRAHYLDSKSLFRCGVYMPRSNPGQAFFVDKLRKSAERESESTPGTPPDSPSSDTDLNTDHPFPQGSPPRSTAPPQESPRGLALSPRGLSPRGLSKGRTRQAWDDTSSPPKRSITDLDGHQHPDTDCTVCMQERRPETPGRRLFTMELPMQGRGTYNGMVGMKGGKYIRPTQEQPNSSRKSKPSTMHLQGRSAPVSRQQSMDYMESGYAQGNDPRKEETKKVTIKEPEIQSVHEFEQTQEVAEAGVAQNDNAQNIHSTTQSELIVTQQSANEAQSEVESQSLPQTEESVVERETERESSVDISLAEMRNEDSKDGSKDERDPSFFVTDDQKPETPRENDERSNAIENANEINDSKHANENEEVEAEVSETDKAEEALEADITVANDNNDITVANDNNDTKSNGADDADEPSDEAEINSVDDNVDENSVLQDENTGDENNNNTANLETQETEGSETDDHIVKESLQLKIDVDIASQLSDPAFEKEQSGQI